MPLRHEGFDPSPPSPDTKGMSVQQTAQNPTNNVPTPTVTTREGSSLPGDPLTEPTKRKVDKQSLEYVVKTGIAGGLAGCAVR